MSTGLRIHLSIRGRLSWVFLSWESFINSTLCVVLFMLSGVHNFLITQYVQKVLPGGSKLGPNFSLLFVSKNRKEPMADRLVKSDSWFEPRKWHFREEKKNQIFEKFKWELLVFILKSQSTHSHDVFRLKFFGWLIWFRLIFVFRLVNYGYDQCTQESKLTGEKLNEILILATY